MNYIEANLAQDEKVIASIKHSWTGLMSGMIRCVYRIAIAVLFFCAKNIFSAIFGESSPSWFSTIYIIAIIVGIFFLFRAIMAVVTTVAEIQFAQLAVTNKRLLGRRGLIRKKTTDIVLNKVDTINVENGFFGAIFNYGTIDIVSPASNLFGSQMRYTYISNTMEFRKAVLDTIEQVKQEEHAAQVEAISQAIAKKEN